MSKKSRSNSPRSDLPPEIQLKIVELAECPIHQNRIRAVCKPWRSAFAHVENRGIKNFPLKLPDEPSPRYGLYIVPTTSYVIQPTNGSFKGSSFLVTVDEINPGFVFPRGPLSVSDPSHLRIRNRSKRVNLLENRLTVVYSGFSLRQLHVQGHASKKDGGGKLGYYMQQESEKTVVCMNPCGEDDLFIIMLLSNKNKLVAFRIRKKVVKKVLNNKVSGFLDIVKFKDKMYGIDNRGRACLIEYDFGSGRDNFEPVTPCVNDGSKGAKRLVVDSTSDKRLYMVALRKCSDISDDITFIVYRLNEDLGVWEKVNSIGNRMFFIGVDFSFSATSHDFPGLAMSCMDSLPENCIFFSKGSFPCRSNEFHGDESLFQMNKEGTGMHIGQYYLTDKCATGLLEPAFVIMFSNPF